MANTLEETGKLKRKVFGILFALVLALSLSLVPAVPASAGAITSIVYTPSGATVWTYVAAFSTVCTFNPTTPITAGSVITLTFPHGTALANIVAGDFTIEQAASGTSQPGTATAPSSIAFDAGTRQIPFTVAAASLSFGGDHDGLGTVTIATSATASGDEIRHPITKTTTGTFSVATSVTDSGSISNVVFVAGPAHHLGFWAPQPTTAVAGVAIAPNVVVKFQDSYGNPTSDTDNITVAIYDNPGGGTLSGTLMVPALNGVATFSDLSIEKTGTGYTLEATSGVLIHGISNPFDITPAPKNKLALVQQPTDSVAGVVIAPAVTVAIQDTYGNQTSDIDDITIAIDNNPGGGTLSGTLTVAAVNGVATFSDLSIDKVGTGYTLEATSGALTPATSNAFDITPAPKSKLAFVQQPTSAVAGVVITPAVTVAIQDAYGNQTSDIDDITIAIDNNPGGGTLSGTLSVAAVNGVATFSNLSIEKTGTGYTLEATSGALTQATSNAFNITPGALASFTISGTPATALAGATFPSPANDITVTARDGFGNIKTDYQGTVTWSSSSIATLPADYTFDGGDAGVHTFVGSQFRLFTAGIQTITVTDAVASVSATSSGITVAALIGGWAPPTPTPTIETNLFGSVLSFSISDTGEILGTVTGTSADGNLTITIPAGTIALDKNGNPLSTIRSDVDPSPPPPPSHIIGLAYDFGPDGATFDPAITLTWSYDPDALPEGVAEENLVVAYYDEGKGEWVDLPTTVDPVTHTITVSVSHFTTFAIIAHPAPAAFSPSNLSIQPSEVHPEEAVTITLSVANTGGTEGSYAVVLKINDVAEATREVTVDAGASEEVTFTTAKDVAGSYSVDVNGLSGSFTVKKPAPAPPPPPPPPPPPTPPPTPPPAPEAINWWLVGGIIAAVIVVGSVTFILVRRRAR